MIYLSLSFKLSALSFTVTRYELYTLCLATYSLRLNNNAMFTCRRLSYSVGRRYLSSVAGYCEGWMPYALGPMLLGLGQLFMDDPIIKEFINLWTSLNSWQKGYQVVSFSTAKRAASSFPMAPMKSISTSDRPITFPVSVSKMTT